MAVAPEGFLSHINPNPKLSVNRGSMALSHRPCLSSFSPYRTEALVGSQSCRRVTAVSLPKVLGPHFNSFSTRMSKNRSFITFAASQEDSKPSEIEVEKKKSELEVGADESQEQWEETLKTFKEQAIKMQSMSQEAYELYSKKAFVILKETSAQLKIQAEKARKDLSVVAKEISEGGKEYLTTAAENSPEEVKDIVETFATTTDDLNEISKVRDFYLGIPYGAMLSLGGFLTFMMTGSISAIRFGVILGGALLALSVSSLRSWRGGQTSDLTVKGQAAIASIIFLREFRLFLLRPSLPGSFMTLVSGAMLVFYSYRIISDGSQKGPNASQGQEN